MKKALLITALATLGLGACAMGGDNRAFVQGINDDTAAVPIPSAGMWRMPSGAVVPMGYAPEQIAQDTILLRAAEPPLRTPANEGFFTEQPGDAYGTLR